MRFFASARKKAPRRRGPKAAAAATGSRQDKAQAASRRLRTEMEGVREAEVAPLEKARRAVELELAEASTTLADHRREAKDAAAAARAQRAEAAAQLQVAEARAAETARLLEHEPPGGTRPAAAAGLGAEVPGYGSAGETQEARNRRNIDRKEQIHRGILRGPRNISETP